MGKLISGIHHITALAGKPQTNIDFYTGILGLRMVKKTVNFDAPDVYHFYYGDETGTPGSILTFFPYPGIQRGRQGKGMLNVIAFSVPAPSRSYWEKRLKQFNVDHKPAQQRFDDEVALYFEDPDGLGLELIFNDQDARPSFTYGAIPMEHSIRGFYSAEIGHEGYERTAGLLAEVMDHKLIAEEGNRFRFGTSNEPGNFVDIICSPNKLRGLGGGGTVHHIAFNTANRVTQLEAREKVQKYGLNPTPVMDRQYFESIYFREPGGVLFEIATAVPGFTIDEAPEDLGTGFKLPPQYESQRESIEKNIQPVHIDTEKFK